MKQLCIQVKQLDMERDGEDGHQAVASLLCKGTGKDGKSDYSGCIKDIHSEILLTHQLDRAKEIQGSKNVGI